ncbi:hypothetical protein [Nonomuraea sp. LPB2021202275-12-8]|uniref:hypothetical protein n=1 Tax=Nonomuraea sp. LPB2021202275-12-8 TaxID=3120159 RepID=UPI00300D6050
MTRSGSEPSPRAGAEAAEQADQPDEQLDVPIPTAGWQPGTSPQGPSTATLAGSGGHVGRQGGGGAVGAFGQQAEPPLPPPAPLVDLVGDIAGLRPRRRRRDGGEVPGADVDLIDELPRNDDEPIPGQRASWPTVAAWLRAGKSAATRRDRLADLAKFVRWWARTAPGAGLWQGHRGRPGRLRRGARHRQRSGGRRRHRPAAARIRQRVRRRPAPGAGIARCAGQSGS